MCKFYQGAEDKALEKQLKSMFAKVFREKPESSRKVRLDIHRGSYQLLIRIGQLMNLNRRAAKHTL